MNHHAKFNTLSTATLTWRTQFFNKCRSPYKNSSMIYNNFFHKLQVQYNEWTKRPLQIYNNWQISVWLYSGTYSCSLFYKDVICFCNCIMGTASMVPLHDSKTYCIYIRYTFICSKCTRYRDILSDLMNMGI